MNIHEAIEKTRRVIRRQHKALSTEDTYLFWLRRYMTSIATKSSLINTQL